jgi:hypothetical protein
MFNKPINIILKTQFETIHSDAIKKAEQDFKTKVLNKVKNLVHFDEFKFLVSEENRIKELIDENNHPYYVKNHSSKHWLLSQFSSRHFLLNVDEFTELKEAIYIGKIDYLIRKRVIFLKSKIPKFTFDDFLLGKECRYLNTYDNYYNIELEDYYKIVTWQSDRLIKIVSYEVELLVKNHQEHCSKIDEPLGFIEKQIQILEEELTESINDAVEIKKILSKLFAFKGFDIDNFNDELLLYNYPSFFNDRIEFRRLNPSTVNKVLTKLSSEPKTPFSNEYMVFYTLDVFLSWLKDIVKGTSIQESFKYPIWEDLLNHKIDEAKQEFQSIIEVIGDFAYNPANSKKVIRNYLSTEFEKQIDAYNKIECKQVFYLLRNENINLLISNFQITTLFNNKEEEYLIDLKKAYVLQNVSWYISVNFNEIFDTKTIYFKRDPGSHLMILSLTNYMILDKELSIELDDAMDIFFTEMHSASLPLDIHFYNHREKYRRIFEKSISRLQDVLDNAEPNKKVLYIQSRLKELRHRELKFRNLVNNVKDLKNREDKYPNIFKEFLSIEAEFIKETVQVSPITFLPNQTNALLLEKETDSFKTFVNQEKQDYILKILEDLAITKDGVYNLGDRSKGAIRGVIEALREEHIIPKLSLKRLCNIMANQINLELKSKLDWSATSDNYHKDAKQYIKNNPLH